MLKVVYFGNSASVFSARHFQALMETPSSLAGVVDLPAVKRDTTNLIPAGLPNFVEKAREQDVPAFEPSDPNSSVFIDELGKLEPDLYISAGYAIILKDALLSVARKLAVNFHASLLPDYRGKHPVFWALRNGERQVGLTVHVMDPGIDTGDVLFQVKVRTRQDDSVNSLYDRIMQRSTRLVGRLIADLENDKLNRQPQPKLGGSYYSSTTDEDYRINWLWDAERIGRYINTTPGKCYQDFAEMRVFFSVAKVIHIQTSLPAGTLVGLGRKHAAIAAGEGAVSLSEIRAGDGRNLSASRFFQEMGIFPGEKLI